MPGTAIVIGATGLVGALLVQELLKDSHFEKVKALVRKPLPFRDGKLEQIVVDFTDEAALQSVLHGDVLFCCIGTTIKKAGSQEAFTAVDYDIPVRCGTIARRNGITQFHLVSSIGAQASSKTSTSVQRAAQKPHYGHWNSRYIYLSTQLPHGQPERNAFR